MILSLKDSLTSASCMESGASKIAPRTAGWSSQNPQLFRGKCVDYVYHLCSVCQSLTQREASWAALRRTLGWVPSGGWEQLGKLPLVVKQEEEQNRIRAGDCQGDPKDAQLTCTGWQKLAQQSEKLGRNLK